MRKQLYQSIIEQLTNISLPSPQGEGAGGEVIKHFDLWNNHLQYIELEGVFPLPAVFIEFLPIHWVKLPRGARQADLSFKLHIITRTKGNDPLTMFDLITAITNATTALAGDGFRACSLDASATDCNHDELIDSQETFTLQCTDSTGTPPTTLAPAPPAPVINI